MHEESSRKARPLPPLNALRAFEAIARHLSFAKAAEELHVTPAALSHQIRGLEEDIGPLFHRRTRAIELTETGRLLYPGAWDRCTLFDVNYRPLRMSVDQLEEGLMSLWRETWSAQALAERKRHYRALLSGRKAAGWHESRPSIPGEAASLGGSGGSVSSPLATVTSDRAPRDG